MYSFVTKRTSIGVNRKISQRETNAILHLYHRLILDLYISSISKSKDINYYIYFIY